MKGREKETKILTDLLVGKESEFVVVMLYFVF